jgi:hypothetical protein
MEARHVNTFTAIQVLALGFLLWFLFTWTGPWNLQRYAGTALVLVGVSFIVAARYQLGRSFSIKPEAYRRKTWF